MIDTNSPEFKDLLRAWVDAIKVMDTKLQAHYSAVAALENSPFAPAAPFFKDAVLLAQKSPALTETMNRKYDSALQKWEQLSQRYDFPESLVAWLREYQLEQPEQNSEPA